MLATTVKRGFPKGVALPDELRALCEFADEHEGPVSGWFEFNEYERLGILAWFGDDVTAADQFAVFGNGADGSLYALWLHAGKDASIAPIVLLDSECAGSQVIAASFRDFLRLLAIGYNEPGRYPTLKPEDPKSAADLRRWVKEEFGLMVPKTGEILVADAQRQHPDLMEWIEAWQKRRSGLT